MPRLPALGALCAAVAVLLPRMRRDFDRDGALRRPTATAMWGCYLAAATLYGDALRAGRPLPPAPRAAAASVAVAGLGLTAAGMGAFGSAAQVTGSEQGPLATRGVYRFSRNPQYVGYVVAGAAGAVARRSPVALALTVGYAVVCRWWVPVEERTLERQLGEEYRRFRDTTPRWLGRPPRTSGTGD